MSGAGGREQWGSRIGVILAAAGSAVGIGNLLRFPGQAANHGGGAFMIPYVLSLLLLGLPAMWIAWTVGRIGGRAGHGTTPGMFDVMTGRPWGKYVGVIGVALPLVFVIYYTYIEAWCLAYSWFSLTGRYEDRAVDLGVFFEEFLGNAPTQNYFVGLGTAALFLVIALALNVWVLWRGVSRGIELLAKVAIPILVLFCIVLGTWTLGQGAGAFAGLEFLWRPDFAALSDPQVWMAAAGQIFFTLTIGYGALECFGSYVRENDDVVLTGLTAASINELVEVVFGSMIAIPAAALYFGPDRIAEIAAGGTFRIGMVSMPEIFRGMGGVHLFGSMWFLLLFFAAFTSSVAVAQPVMAFFQDEMRMTRAVSAAVLGVVWALASVPIVLYYRYGALDEMDFWAGTIGLVLFTTIEVVIFSWIFGIDRGWKEMHRGAEIRVPGVYRWVMRVVTPLVLFAIFGAWFFDAIIHDRLIPAPRIHAGFDNVKGFAGRFRLERPPEGSDAARELERIEAGLRAAVERRHRDIPIWFEIVIHPSSPIGVDRIGTQPDVLDEIGLERLNRYVRLLGPRYDPATGETLRPHEVTLAVEVRYRAWAIWITRAIMALITAAFLFMIWATWKGRRRRPAEAAR
ncbi:MAG: sodium:calcium symporter [Acidobacteria bacterium]|nr:MAG: sodium:calcium symporter [Acidobacteriota bacterium]